MPEGPEIKRAADRIANVIQRRIVQSAQIHLPAIAEYAHQFEGRRVVAVEPRGKALLISIGPELVLYSHNQLYGRWYTTRPGKKPRTQRQLRVALHTNQGSAWLYSASDVRVMTRDAVDQHPYLRKLGPDPLQESITEDDIMARLEDPAYRGRALGGLFLDQGFVAGIGNYLRSEILFMARIHPKRRPKDLSGRQRRQLARRTLQLARQAYETGGITNDLRRVEKLIRRGQRRWQYRHWVFARAGKPCYRCKAKIKKTTVASRRLYYCATCQPAE